MVPLRTVCEAMGSEVIWNETTQIVSVSKDKTELLLQIDRQEMYRNGKMVWLDAAAQLIGERTFVPLRFVAEGLGATVTWEETDKTVTITF